MTRPFLLIAAVYAACVAETTIGARFQVGGFRPDLLLLCAVAALATIAGPLAVVFAATIGLVADTLAPGPLGLGMGACAIVGGLSHARLANAESSIVSRCLLGAVAVTALVAATTLARAVATNPDVSIGRLTTTILGDAALTTLVGWGALAAATFGRAVFVRLFGHRNAAPAWRTPRA